eukprot:gene2881-5647_t
MGSGATRMASTPEKSTPLNGPRPDLADSPSDTLSNSAETFVTPNTPNNALHTQQLSSSVTETEPEPNRTSSWLNARPSYIPPPDANLELAYSAMSLEMDNEDLLFNLYYFGGGAAMANIQSAYSTAIEETFAAHSAANTPYKLRPAAESAMSQLSSSVLNEDYGIIDDFECSVCKDEMELGCEVTKLPGCGHVFHYDCVVRWLKLQGWCPICRCEILAETTTEEVLGEEEEEEEEEQEQENVTETNSDGAEDEDEDQEEDEEDLPASSLPEQQLQEKEEEDDSRHDHDHGLLQTQCPFDNDMAKNSPSVLSFTRSSSSSSCCCFPREEHQKQQRRHLSACEDRKREGTIMEHADDTTDCKRLVGSRSSATFPSISLWKENEEEVDEAKGDEKRQGRENILEEK